MLDFVQFEDIDKNKWNGNIHYSPNGNIYGYYWYLKSVLKEWDAIIEGDYQSVMPIPRHPLSRFERTMLPILGPYTVNGYSKYRATAFYEMWVKHRVDIAYNFNDRFGKNMYEINPSLITQDISYINLLPDYDSIAAKYNDQAIKMLHEATKFSHIFGSDIKPEMMLENEKIGHSDKHTLYRIMYNAIQRGVGWSLKVENNVKNSYTKTFYIADKSGIYEIFTTSKNGQYTTLLMTDHLIRSNAGKPINLYIHPSNQSLSENLGSEILEIFVSDTTKMSFKEKLNNLLGLKTSLF